jgi:hypothetical protein
LWLEGAASVKFPKPRDYVSQHIFGYGDYRMSGLEYYIADGSAGVIGKASLQQEIFKYIFKNPFQSKTHDKIPFRFFLKLYGNLGYAHNPYSQPNNKLDNTLLRTWGVGLDVVSIYDFVFKIEFSFNQMGQRGLYLHNGNE